MQIDNRKAVPIILLVILNCVASLLLYAGETPLIHIDFEDLSGRSSLIDLGRNKTGIHDGGFNYSPNLPPGHREGFSLELSKSESISYPSVRETLSNFTVMCWVFPIERGEWTRPLGNVMPDVSAGFAISMGPKMSFRFGFAQKSNGSSIKNCSVQFADESIPVGVWSHLAVVYLAGSEIKGFVNGKEMSAVSKYPSKNWGAIVTSSAKFSLNGGNKKSALRMDGVYLFTNALSVEQIGDWAEHPDTSYLTNSKLMDTVLKDESEYIIGNTGGKTDSQETATGALGLSIDCTKSLGKVNPAVMGTCLRPQRVTSYETVRFNDVGDFQSSGYGLIQSFSANGVNRLAPIFKNTSTRLWMQTMPNETVLWEMQAPLIKAMYPAKYFVLNNTAQGSYKNKVAYRSESDNTLVGTAQPKVYAGGALTAWLRLKEILGTEIFEMYYEIWNEPQFPGNGTWDPVSFAAYTKDAARHVRSIGKKIKIAASLNLGDAVWNDQLLQRIQPEEIDCVVNHNYGSSWINISKDTGETYFARMGEIAKQYALIGNNLELTAKYGRGNWEYAITEWNIHPEGYKGLFPANGDMAAALYHGMMLNLFLEKKVSAAQQFQLQGTTHFGLIRDADALAPFPAFFVYDFYTRYLKGSLVHTVVQSPTFPWRTAPVEGKPDTKVYDEKVQALRAVASRTTTHLNVILINLLPKTDVRIPITLTGAVPHGTIISEELNGWDLGGLSSTAEEIISKVYETNEAVASCYDGKELTLSVRRHGLKAFRIPIKTAER
ncbi:MAG: LamG-like jellyroll fold domain-containing protein [Spirochaetota bacterium]